MPEQTQILHTCDAYSEPPHNRRYFPKAICLVKRPAQLIIGIYAIGDIGMIHAGPIEYGISVILGEFPHRQQWIIDSGGRNHGLTCPILVSPHDINTAVIRASLYTDVAMNALRRELS
jgi:hypothetical protein